MPTFTPKKPWTSVSGIWGTISHELKKINVHSKLQWCFWTSARVNSVYPFCNDGLESTSQISISCLLQELLGLHFLFVSMKTLLSKFKHGLELDNLINSRHMKFSTYQSFCAHLVCHLGCQEQCIVLKCQTRSLLKCVISVQNMFWMKPQNMLPIPHQKRCLKTLIMKCYS